VCGQKGKKETIAQLKGVMRTTDGPPSWICVQTCEKAAYLRGKSLIPRGASRKERSRSRCSIAAEEGRRAGQGTEVIISFRS